MAITINEGDMRLRPKHCRKFAQFSREWYTACDKAFVKAMLREKIDRLNTYISFAVYAYL